jgi:drug/metabolite transporter (DMT)-like permease
VKQDSEYLKQVPTSTFGSHPTTGLLTRCVPNWKAVFAVIFRSVMSLMGQFMNMLVMLSAELAGINFSLVMNLYSLTPFLMAILFFSVFKEKLARAHMVGMIFIFACVLITGESNSQAEKPADAKISALIPLFLALLASVNFTITNFLSRYFIYKGCM